MSILSEELTADNTFSDGIVVSGKFDWSLSGTWVGTVTVQRKRADGQGWEDIEAFTENGTYVGEDVETNTTIQYRFGFKAGDYTSGVAAGRLSV